MPAGMPALLSLHDPQPAVVGAHVPQPSLRINDHLANADALGWQWDHAHRAVFRIETHHRVGIDLVHPDDAGAIDGYSIRAGAAPGGQGMLLHDSLRCRVHLRELAGAVQRYPQHAVGANRHAPRAGAVAHFEFGDGSGCRIEAPQTVAAHLAEPDVAAFIDCDTVRTAASAVLGDLAAGDIQSS